MRALIRHDVEHGARALGAAHPLNSVDVAPGDDPSLVVIAIAYVHVRDGPPDNLVYPFYLGSRCRCRRRSSTTAPTSSCATSWSGASRSTRRSGPTTTRATRASR